MPRALALLALLTVLPACAVHSAAGFAPPRERATECHDYCGALDMRLAAVVVMMNHAGCVCEPLDAARASADRGAAVAGGAAVHAILEQRARTAGSSQPVR